MRLFLRHTLFFLLLTAVIYPLTIFCSSYLNNSWIGSNVSNQLGAYGHLYTRISEADSTHNIDVLALGSSLCYRGIDPREFQKHDLELFNLGSSGQSHIQTSILLKQYLAQFNPEYVIYECSPSLFSNDGVGSGLDLIYNTHLGWNHLDMALEINNIKLYNALIHSGMQRLMGQYKDFSELKLKEKNHYISGGYVEKELEFYRHTPEKETAALPFKPTHYQLKAFIENVKLIKESGAELFLIQAPITSSSYRDYPSADSLFYSLGNYINFNGVIELDDSLHFYDHTHLNQRGVTLFNEVIIDRLNML